MYIKFLKHGKGDPAKASSYLIDEVDHLNRPRPDIQVLRGDPQTFTAIAQSITNEWIYTSGVIAWSKSDNPTDADINEVLDTFENHAFAGLQPNQYHFTAVLHEEDDGSKHVHFLVPRIELETGKALNIAPPGHEKYYDPLRDYFNYSKGWSRPDDSTLQRDTQTPNHVHFQDKFAVRAGLKDKPVNDIREMVGSYIEQRIEHGFIRNRKDVLEAVSELGTVTRTNDKFISLKIDGAEKAIRLKGAFYESEFSIESYFENRTREANDARASSEYRIISAEHRELAQQLRTEFTELGGKRSTYNRERYQAVIGSQTEPSFNPNREQEFSQIFTATNGRSSNTFEPTSAAAPEPKNTIRSIEQYEPRNSRNSQDQENPFYIQHGFSFDSSYFTYIEHLSKLRQQEQIQRHKRDGEQSRVFEIQRGEHEYQQLRQPIVHPNRHEQTELSGWIPNSEGDQLNDVRSTIIEDYRRSTIAIEATTASTRRSFTAYTSTVSDNQRIEAIHANFKRQAQRSSEDRAEISADRAESIRTDYFSKFFSETTRKFGISASRTFERVSDEFEYRFRGEANNSQRATEVSASRDRATIEADGRSNHQENDFSRAISTKISGINPTAIFSALDMLDQRRELQRAQERKNDRGYDSPSPF
jgi:hypothetical protein